MRSITAFLLPASSVRRFRMTRVAVLRGSGAGRNLTLFFAHESYRPAPLPSDSQSIVIPNHVRQAEGRSGEGSHARKAPVFILSLGTREVGEAISLK